MEFEYLFYINIFTIELNPNLDALYTLYNYVTYSPDCNRCLSLEKKLNFFLLNDVFY